MGILSAAIYIVIIARLHLMTAALFTLIALIQLIPPIIVRRFLEQNCEDNQNIETEITNVILEAYHGFAVLKLYKLKDWYLKRLSGLNKKYLKIGNGGIYANTAEDTLNQFVSTLLKYGTYAEDTGFSVTEAEQLAGLQTV